MHVQTERHRLDDAGSGCRSRGVRARRSRHSPRIVWLAAGLIAMAVLIAVPARASRFSIDASLRPTATSTDGRFTVDASAGVAPEVRSADGRYALKSVNVPDGGCATGPLDPLFASGFEDP